MYSVVTLVHGRMNTMRIDFAEQARKTASGPYTASQAVPRALLHGVGVAT